ncbi:unknown [Bacteroides sp. CAG:927]|jgi:hypothetical protein|nr:unknown [Bacteroides sp. CAG:927]
MRKILQKQIIIVKMNMSSLDILTGEVYGKVGTSANLV